MPNPPRSIAHHPKLARIILSRPYLTSGILVGILTGFLIPSPLVSQPLTRALIGWNAGVLVYLVTTLWMMFASSHEHMKQRAIQHDDGRMLILVMVIVAAIATLSGIVSELGLARDLHGSERSLHVGLSVATLLSSWAFSQVTMACHYAHDYYLALHGRGAGTDGGLQFPGEDKPDYADFLYFSCVIGTSGQTADVVFTSRPMRRIGTVHCVMAFFFNATLLALTINIASGLM